jgi:hypothetical protein
VHLGVSKIQEMGVSKIQEIGRARAAFAHNAISSVDDLLNFRTSLAVEATRV